MEYTLATNPVDEGDGYVRMRQSDPRPWSPTNVFNFSLYMSRSAKLPSTNFFLRFHAFHTPEHPMNVKDAIRSSANLSSMVLKTYISDLDDADLMRRPGEGCNHLAWQLGHLISSEVQLLESVAPGQAIDLPKGSRV